VSAAMLDAPSRAVAEASSPAPRGGGRMTLEARLQGAWRLLRAEGAAACPACGGEMTLRAGIGECGDCGARMR
jgi:hypothetical protein